MATLLLRRSLQRREFSSLSASSFASLVGKSQDTALLGSRFSSLVRPFSSRPVENDAMGIDLGVTNPGTAVMEGKDAGVSLKKEFDEVFLAGGVNRVSKLQERVSDIFGKSPIKGVNPNKAVASAAIQGGILRGNAFTGLIYRNTTIPTMNSRVFSTAAESLTEAPTKEQKISFRPLSPHLPVYEPQSNSTISIFHRISGIYLTAVTLFYYLLYMKMGLIGFTFEGFYNFLFYSSKLILISAELTALALCYHLYAGGRHLLKDIPAVIRRLRF